MTSTERKIMMKYKKEKIGVVSKSLFAGVESISKKTPVKTMNSKDALIGNITRTQDRARREKDE